MELLRGSSMHGIFVFAGKQQGRLLHTWCNFPCCLPGGTNVPCMEVPRKSSNEYVPLECVCSPCGYTRPMSVYALVIFLTKWKIALLQSQPNRSVSNLLKLANFIWEKVKTRKEPKKSKKINKIEHSKTSL